MTGFVFETLDLIGKPFKYGGRGPDSYDCWGVVMEMMRRNGVSVPDYGHATDHRTIAAMMLGAKPQWEPCKPQPGALLLIRVKGLHCHVGFQVAENYFIHAMEAPGVCVERISLWENKIEGFYRYVG